MNRLELAGYVRSLCGRGYSVADEEGTLDGQLRFVIVRRGKEEILAVEMVESWIEGLSVPPVTEDRMLLKHLAICVKRFFSHPESLPDKAFRWPGTAQNRTKIRNALDPRRHRRPFSLSSRENSLE
ncbi:MAG: hypothetical protein JWO59_2626 [Chloroflexi bacterium]|nr:hypothetical protein [Chloroflexota bacterium]